MEPVHIEIGNRVIHTCESITLRELVREIESVIKKRKVSTKVKIFIACETKQAIAMFTKKHRIFRRALINALVELHAVSRPHRANPVFRLAQIAEM